MADSALSPLRICDLTGQLAGAGGTRILAAFGAEVIRVEDPVNEGHWDILRGAPPFVDDRRGIELGGAFNNHNVEKLGITLNLRTERGRDLLRRLIAVSDVVTENFSAGVLRRYGLSYDAMRALRPDIIYVSSCGFGHSGPYRDFKTWGQTVQAVSGLSFSMSLPGLEPAGWGFAYMDHTGAYYLAMAVLLAVHHRNRTGEGQWVDLSTTEVGATLTGPAMLDYTVNGRPLRRAGMPHANRSQAPPMAPHGVYPASDEDTWVAIACRNDQDWCAMRDTLAEPWACEDYFATLPGRLQYEDELDERLSSWTRRRDNFATATLLKDAGVPANAVLNQPQRIEDDPNIQAWGLWPEVEHPEMGRVPVDGLPVHLSETDWRLQQSAPCLGQHNAQIYGDLLGLSAEEIDALRQEGVI